uniref:U1-type domain-containing protein n=1 Tax=Schistosoma mansoni TaxID=6183 RepID=A0A5K4F754_SCHMA
MSDVVECFVCKIIFCDQETYWKHVYEDDCHNPCRTSTADFSNDKNNIQKSVESVSKISKNPGIPSTNQASDVLLKASSSDKAYSIKVPLKRNPTNKAYCDVCQTSMTPFDLIRHETGKKHLKMLEKANLCAPKSVNGHQDANYSTVNHQRNSFKVENYFDPNHNPCSITEDMSSYKTLSSETPVKCDADSQYIPSVRSLLNFNVTSENNSNKSATKSILRRLCMTEISSLLTQMVGDMYQKANFYRQLKMKCRDDLNSILCLEVPILPGTVSQELTERNLPGLNSIYHGESTSLSQLLLSWVKQLHALDND